MKVASRGDGATYNNRTGSTNVGVGYLVALIRVGVEQMPQSLAMGQSRAKHNTAQGVLGRGATQSRVESQLCSGGRPG
eukprot:6387935-Pyramimonas_sp.AAC.1